MITISLLIFNSEITHLHELFQQVTDQENIL